MNLAAVGSFAVRSISFHSQRKGSLTGVEELVKDERESNINRPEFSQPISTAVQVALIELLRSFGIHASVVAGHSSGEIAAA